VYNNAVLSVDSRKITPSWKISTRSGKSFLSVKDNLTTAN